MNEKLFILCLYRIFFADSTLDVMTFNEAMETPDDFMVEF